MRSHHAEGEGSLLSRLLEGYGGPEDDALALLAFQLLATPRLDLLPRGHERREGGGDSPPELGIVLAGGLEPLRDGWNRFFRPRIPELAEALESILAGHLPRARLLSRAAGEEERLRRGEGAARPARTAGRLV